MNTHIQKTVFWETKKTPVIKTLDGNITVNITIIGGGMAGLAAAQKFVDAGKTVVVVEKSFVGSGASGKSSGMISQDSELELTDLIANLGKEKAKKLWEFVGTSMETMRHNIIQNNIDCDYQEQDYVFLANSKGSMRKVFDEEASRKSLNYKSTVYTEKNIADLTYARGCKGAIRYPGTFGINSFLYAQGMKEVLAVQGVQFFENTTVTHFDNNHVYAEKYTITTEKIIVCVDRFLPSLQKLKKSVYHVQTYLTASKPLSDEVIKKIFPQGNVMVSDSDIIYQYFRITGDKRLLLGGGNFLTTYWPFENSKPEQILPKLERYLHKKFPCIDIEFEYLWPGLLGVSKDLVPLAGQDKDQNNVYYVAGATGLAWASGLGNYIAEKVLDGRNDYDELFDLYRPFPLDPIMSFVQPLVSTPMTFGLSHALVKYVRQIFS